MNNENNIPPLPPSNSNMMPPPLPQPKAHPLNRFFSIDFANLPINSQTPFRDEYSEYTGTTKRVYMLNLNGYDLGTFNRVEVIWHSDNEYNIKFISERPIITPALADFINYCAQLYGPDTNGASIITNEDIYNSQHYLFSRMWNDVSIHQDATGLSNELLTLTIFYEKKY